MTLLTDGFPKSKRGTLLHDGSLGWERAHAFDYMTIRSKLGAQIEWNEDGTLKLKDDYVPVTTRERLRAEAAIQELHDRLDAIYEALYSGEQSKDGLYWYAFEQTARGVMAQPKGYMAYDDQYAIEGEDVLGKGAVGYPEKLKSSEVLMYFLRPINYKDTESTIRLEVPDGIDADLGAAGGIALEEASSEDGLLSGAEGVTPEGGDRGTGTGNGSDTGSTGAGGGPGSGQGNSPSADDLSAVGGGDADTSTGLDAIQFIPDLDYEIRSSVELEQTSPTARFNNNIAAIRTLKLIEAECGDLPQFLVPCSKLDFDSPSR